MNVTTYQKGPNNLLHLVLTICTGGLWLPVWILRNRRRTYVVTIDAAGRPIKRRI